jgi:hypothetical protein
VPTQAGQSLLQDGCREVGDIRGDHQDSLRTIVKRRPQSPPQPHTEIAGRLRRIREITPQPGSKFPTGGSGVADSDAGRATRAGRARHRRGVLGQAPMP